jgi:hypothetical protein
MIRGGSIAKRGLCVAHPVLFWVAQVLNKRLPDGVSVLESAQYILAEPQIDAQASWMYYFVLPSFFPTTKI